MRVLVELLDKEPLENVLGSCIFEPEIVVFLCDERDSTLIKESAVYRLFRHRRLKTKPRFLYFDATDPLLIVRVMGAVTRDYPGCVIDFTGGRDLVLLAAGIFCAKNGVPGYYIDLPSNRFIPVLGDCSALAARYTLPHFSVEDLLALAGATVHGHGHFDAVFIDEDLERDIEAVWAIVQQSPRAWNEFSSMLQALCGRGPAAGLVVEGPALLRQPGGGQLRCNPDIARSLEEAGVFSGLLHDGTQVRFRIKSPLHKRCLLNSGIWLELHCYVLAKRTGFFDDVRTSVVIDWAGVEGGSDNTKNEVDLLLVRGVTALFVSCKMSVPSPLALAEIMLLARKFGGQLARPVVVTAARLGKEHKALRLRAQDMGVELLDGDVIAENRLGGRLCAIAGNPGIRLHRQDEV